MHTSDQHPMIFCFFLGENSWYHSSINVYTHIGKRRYKLLKITHKLIWFWIWWNAQCNIYIYVCNIYEVYSFIRWYVVVLKPIGRQMSESRLWLYYFIVSENDWLSKFSAYFWKLHYVLYTTCCTIFIFAIYCYMDVLFF